MNKFGKLSSEQISEMVSSRFTTKKSIESLIEEVSEVQIKKRETYAQENMEGEDETSYLLQALA